LTQLVVELVVVSGDVVLPSSFVVEASSAFLATLTAAAPAFPPIDVEELDVVDVEGALPGLPLPPPGPTLGSPGFFPDFTMQSCFLCSLLPQIQQREALSATPSHE
jgi:hypothetical protein